MNAGKAHLSSVPFFHKPNVLLRISLSSEVPTSPLTRATTMNLTWLWEVLAQSQDINNNIIIKGRYSHPSGQSVHTYARKTNSP